MPAAQALELLHQGLLRGHPGLEGGEKVFPLGAFHPGDVHFLHVGMDEDGLLDVAGVHLAAPELEFPVPAPEQVEKTIGVQPAEVPGEEPAVADSRGGLGFVPEKSVHQGRGLQRSEEHTSELQSPCNLVCRLLLEKKKKVKPDLCSQNTTVIEYTMEHVHVHVYCE